MRPSTASILVLAVIFLGGLGGLSGWSYEAPGAEGGPAGAADPGRSLMKVIEEEPFPGHQEVMDRVDALESDPWFTVHDIGESREARALRLVEVVDPDSPVPLEERAVTLLLTQQHGNEPAGTPAVLDLLDGIANGDPVRKTLSNQVLLVLPMANPDGSEEGARHNADDKDTNRDHNHLETLEGRTMHRVVSEWGVHVALDHHEYGGTGLGDPFPVRVYDYDLTTLVPTHAGVHPMVMTMVRDLMYNGIWPFVEEEGYTVNEYGEATVAGEPLGHLAGGPDPGILRNHLGLHHVAGILIETRVDSHPNPMHDAQKRIHIQSLTMEGTLRYVHENAGLFVAMREATMKANVVDAPGWYDEGDWRGLTDLEGEGRQRERIPAAYQVDADPNPVTALFDRHALPAGAVTQEGVVHNVDHAWPVHAAALLSDASSRRVFDALATDPVVDGVEAGPVEPEEAPGVGLFVTFFVLVNAVWLAARSGHRARRER